MQIVNTEQAEAWDGHEGDVWTKQADLYDRAGHRHLEKFFAAGVIGRGDSVVDIGCGTGRATRDAAKIATDGSALGIDLSSQMLECARERSAAEGLTNVTFVRGDAQVHPFDEGAYDVAMSSFGAMFFNDPVAAFTNIGRGLRSGGRLALLAWRELDRNEWLMSLRGALAAGRDLPMPPPGVPSPFALADTESRTAAWSRRATRTSSSRPSTNRWISATPQPTRTRSWRRWESSKACRTTLTTARRPTRWPRSGRYSRITRRPDAVLLNSSAWLITASR